MGILGGRRRKTLINQGIAQGHRIVAIAVLTLSQLPNRQLPSSRIRESSGLSAK